MFNIYLANSHTKDGGTSYHFTAGEISAGRARKKGSQLYNARDKKTCTHILITRNGKFYRRIG